MQTNAVERMHADTERRILLALHNAEKSRGGLLFIKGYSRKDSSRTPDDFMDDVQTSGENYSMNSLFQFYRGNAATNYRVAPSHCQTYPDGFPQNSWSLLSHFVASILPSVDAAIAAAGHR